jgi:integrase
MAKLKSYQLIARGKKGIYSLRISIDGKDCWRSTKTANLKEAEKRAEAIVETLRSTAVLSQRETSVHKVTRYLAEVAVEQATGKAVKKMSLDAAYNAWVDLQDEYSDITVATRDFHKAILNRFVQYASNTEKIEYIDQVTPEITKKYAKYLWGLKITSKTFNEHIQCLSSVFATLDSIHFLPYRNPFNKNIIKRRKKSGSDIESHKAIEPENINKLITMAAKHGEGYRDLFVLATNTGMRLKDACLLEWENVETDFIDIELCKTSKTGNRARIPISKTLKKMFTSLRNKSESKYVLNSIAEDYNNYAPGVRTKTKKIFEKVFGKENTQAKKGAHRKINSSILSFHSFRVTFMSLLASRDVSIRMAMRIMGWLSPEMIKVYERELANAKNEADKRSLELVDSIDELQFDIPKVTTSTPVLKPTKDALKELVTQYSNITIGKIYCITSTAIRKHLNKHGIVRAKRIESADVSDAKIIEIRKDLMEGVKDE